MARFKPSTEVVLRSRADFIALPRTDSYRNSIQELTISPTSLMDQGWVTAALRILGPKLVNLNVLELDNLDLDARHPDFYKIWLLIRRQGRRLIVGRMFNISPSRMAYLLQGCDVDMHISNLESWPIHGSVYNSSLSSANNLRGCTFSMCHKELAAPSSTRPLVVKITLERPKVSEWHHLLHLVSALAAVYSHHLWDLRLMYQDHSGEPTLYDHHFFSSLLQPLSSLHTLRLDTFSFSPPGHLDRGLGSTTHLQCLELFNASLDRRQVAWLWTILKFRKLVVAGPVAKFEGSPRSAH
ncbi:hypothetical protein EIP91_000357 [Steccherinum ochraceum]|uniref:F-box domain-containing protein n=1 Tax=Steccherinum ochraceum TaxID=92696 RepID=A0A4R0RTX3_9APHY|nr:hypothetical protein EIP91_000357 [Steccherinum ochraceum]